MSNINIMRAWKDADYRLSLTAEQRANIPAHPSGAIEFQDRSFVGATDSLFHGCSPCHRCASGSIAP